MTAYRQDGTRLTRATFPTAAVPNTDPLVEITENVYEGQSIGAGGIGSNVNVGPRGFNAARSLKFRKGQKVRTSEVDAMFPTAKVSTVTPATGPGTGGTAVTITGTDLAGASGATVAGAALTGFKVVNDTTVTGSTPPSPTLIPAPVQGVPTTATTGGALAAATYNYVVAAINAAGETIASNERAITTTGATSTVAVNWAAVAGATGYRVYRSTTPGVYGATSLVAAVGAATTVTDTGAALAAGTPRSTNSTGAGAKDVVVADDGGNVTLTNGFTYS